MPDLTKTHQVYKNKAGIVVPGVTTVLEQLGWNKQALMRWSANQAKAGFEADKVRDKAANIGTIAHYLIECHLKHETPELGDFSANNIEQANKALEAYKGWESSQDSEIRLMGSELGFVHERLMFGGTIDSVVESIRDSGSRLWLIDFKTSTGVYPEMHVQVSAYKELYQQNTGKTIDEVHILRLSKTDATFEHHTISDERLKWGWDVFVHCLELYKLSKSK